MRNNTSNKTTLGLIAAAKKLRSELDRLQFSSPVSWVYNPLHYAWEANETYLKLYSGGSCKVFLLGMNPGPWGMAQTGVPFGEVEAVRSYLKIETKIGKPDREHPKRPIEGFACTRSEVSGKRLWGLFSERYPLAKDFFAEHFVSNYCPLVFMDDGARNVTPDKLPAAEAGQLDTICDQHLQTSLLLLNPEYVVGIGAYAEDCLKRVCKSHSQLESMTTCKILHPSPASPAANRGWAEQATKQLCDAGVW
jgi:single-strand selective monofunctional uracil DNA glycosylase